MSCEQAASLSDSKHRVPALKIFCMCSQKHYIQTRELGSVIGRLGS